MLEVQEPPAASAVFEHWRQVTGRAAAKFKGKRKARVLDRLKDGYTVDDLKQAVDGCALTPHNMGQNDRGEKYNDLELICRDVEHVDRFIQNARDPPSPKAIEKPRDITRGTARAEDFTGQHDKGYAF